jgi:hypothetical protein
MIIKYIITTYKKYIINNFISMNNNFTIDGIDGIDKIDMNNNCRCSNKIISLILQLKQNECKKQNCDNEKNDLIDNIRYYDREKLIEEKNKICKLTTDCGIYHQIYTDENYNIKLREAYISCTDQQGSAGFGRFLVIW